MVRHGETRGRDTTLTRGWSESAKIGWYTGPRNEGGCRDWLGAFDLKGYATLWSNGSSKRVSRLILGLPKGDPLFALHSCDRPSCVEPSHLRPGTPKENSRDAVLRGRQVRGELTGNSRLTAAEVALALGLVRSGGSCRSVAMALAVSSSAIEAVVRGETWLHVVAVDSRMKIEIKAHEMGVCLGPKTHCVRGHALLGDNVQVTPRQRKCRACAREWARNKRSVLRSVRQ